MMRARPALVSAPGRRPMGEIVDKFEYASPAWLTAVRHVLGTRLAGEDLTGIDYSYCQELTDPPTHLLRAHESTISWHFRLSEDGIDVGEGLPERPTVKLVVDYQTLLPLARTVMADDPDYLERVRQLMTEATAAGKLRIEGDLANQPEVLARIGLHDLMASWTA